MSNMNQSQNERSLQDIQEDLRLYNSLQHFLSQGDASANSAEGLNNGGNNNGDGPVQFANEIDNAGTADPLRAQPAHRDGDDMPADNAQVVEQAAGQVHGQRFGIPGFNQVPQGGHVEAYGFAMDIDEASQGQSGEGASFEQPLTNAFENIPVPMQQDNSNVYNSQPQLYNNPAGFVGYGSGNSQVSHGQQGGFGNDAPNAQQVPTLTVPVNESQQHGNQFGYPAHDQNVGQFYYGQPNMYNSNIPFGYHEAPTHYYNFNQPSYSGAGHVGPQSQFGGDMSPGQTLQGQPAGSGDFVQPRDENAAQQPAGNYNFSIDYMNSYGNVGPSSQQYGGDSYGAQESQNSFGLDPAFLSQLRRNHERASMETQSLFSQNIQSFGPMGSPFINPTSHFQGQTVNNGQYLNPPNPPTLLILQHQRQVLQNLPAANTQIDPNLLNMNKNSPSTTVDEASRAGVAPNTIDEAPSAGSSASGAIAGAVPPASASALTGTSSSDIPVTAAATTTTTTTTTSNTADTATTATAPAPPKRRRGNPVPIVVTEFAANRSSVEKKGVKTTYLTTGAGRGVLTARCEWEGCSEKAVGDDMASILLELESHLEVEHGEEPRCRWEGCLYVPQSSRTSVSACMLRHFKQLHLKSAVRM